jgi:hypothetical protein
VAEHGTAAAHLLLAQLKGSAADPLEPSESPGAGSDDPTRTDMRIALVRRATTAAAD